MKFVPNKLSIVVNKTALVASKHSPQLLLGAGVVGFAATVVLAAKATLKIEDILDEARELADQVDDLPTEKYSDEEKSRIKTYVKIKTGVKIVRLYLPALAVGALTIAALTGSHRILTKRNAGLTAAYGALDKGFREYQSRVVEEVGEEKERYIRHGVTTEKVAVIDDAGKKTVVEKKVSNRGPASEYARLFADETTPLWTSRPELNFVLIRGIQTQMNMNLQANGFVLLNDVYKELGFPLSTVGAQVGWILNSDHGDRVIDFGIFDDDMGVWEYVTGRTDGAIWLDFNVDGIVLDKIDQINSWFRR